jgi:hypothetical protein
MPYVEYTRGTDGEETRRDDSGGKSYGLHARELHLWTLVLVVDFFMFETHSIMIIFFLFHKVTVTLLGPHQGKTTCDIYTYVTITWSQ